MELQKGSVVRSKAGRDKTYFFAVVAIEERYVYLCDGKERKLEHPKKKNSCHIAVTNTVLPLEAMASNRALRKALRPFQEGAQHVSICEEETACRNRI